MSQLRFDDAVRIAAHLRVSAASATRKPTFDQQIARYAKANGLSAEAATEAAISGAATLDHTAGADVPVGLWFVKDDGIYLMSNGDREGDLGVVYAKGYDPKNGDVWEKCRDAVGGDDFGEFIAESGFAGITDEDCLGAVVNVTTTSISVGTLHRAPTR